MRLPRHPSDAHPVQHRPLGSGVRGPPCYLSGMVPFYDKDGITIFCGRWEEVWPTLGLKPSDVALCWADPPYGIALKTTGSKGRSVNAKANDWAPVAGDEAPFNPAHLLAFPRSVLWGGNHYASRLPDSPSWLVWDKRDGAGSNDNADCEMAWTNLGGPARLFHHLWMGMITASERLPGGGIPRLHPTQKPVALCEWGFKRAGLKRGDLVFSPYLGSGPEVRAALNMGLRLIGCELVEAYCDAVVKHRTGLARYVEGQAPLF